MTKTKESKFSPKAFAEAERVPVSRDEFSRVFSKVLANPAKPKTKSENREPTREELAVRFHLKRGSR